MSCDVNVTSMDPWTLWDKMKKHTSTVVEDETNGGTSILCALAAA